MQQERAAAKDRTDQLVVEAERQKANLERPLTGNATLQQKDLDESSHLNTPGTTDLECDKKLYALSVHLDKSLVSRIIRGEFIDLSKLLPRDKVVPEDDIDKVQIVSKDGKPAFEPFFDKDSTIITNYRRWELAFDIYAGVYTRAHPLRAPELYEYKHTIRRASDTFIWSNVYDYDKVFRTHMQFNPRRTWALKHQDAWSDHVRVFKSSAQGAALDVSTSSKKRKPCRFFNKNGKCTKGSSCEFDHKCSFCNIFGHGRYNCRKLLATVKKEPPAVSSTTPEVQ